MITMLSEENKEESRRCERGCKRRSERRGRNKKRRHGGYDQIKEGGGGQEVDAVIQYVTV